ncbi:tetratricopeptide repeat protein [Oceanobacillus sp. FSL K6-2867]|uniref:tetratricopeptide repeat protein n=1 Tax=Oceanobacillus sp. FSL K6-2867 TaxID=2954748 RepID=UPI0030D9A4DC
MITNLELDRQQTDGMLSLCMKVREQIIKDSTSGIKEKIKEMEGLLESKGEYSTRERFFMLSTMAKYYRKASNYDKGGNYSRQAIRLSKEIEDNYIELVIDTYLDYAALESDYGQLSNARIELAKLLALLDSKNYQDAYAYGAIFSRLGKVALAEENMESGLTQLEKALSYFHKAVPFTHPIIAQTIDILSDAYINMENYTKALECHQQLLKAYQEEKDKEAEARTLLKIGEIQFYMDLKQARKTLTQAIKHMDELYKGNHLDIAKAILMLAEIDENMGSFPRAINYYKQALGQLTTFYDDTHFMIVYIYSKIGTISMKIFKLNEAKKYLEKGLKLATAFPRIRQQYLYALGKIYSDEKSYDKAFKMFKEFLERLEQEGRKKSIAYGNTLQAIAFNYLQQEKIEDAFSYYNEALAIYETLPNCKEEKGLTLIRLAYCYENKEEKNVNKAESCYEKGFKIIGKVHQPELFEEALAGIIEFFTRNHNPHKLRIYEDKFVKLQTRKATF